MNKLTKEAVEIYSEIDDENISKNLSTLYLEVLDEFVKANYPNGIENTTLMCSIHNNFKEGHNCVACNLQTYSAIILRYLSGFKHFTDMHLTSVNFHLLLYLMVERYSVYFKIINLQESYRLKHFGVFQKITQWANFLKHPKSFMLAHHAIYWIRGIEYNSEHWFYDTIENAKKHKKIVDDTFVKEYYSGDKNNEKLLKIFSKKGDFVVAFPNPVELIKEFIIAQNKFVEMIKENEVIREILDDNATIIEYFQQEIDNAG